MANKIRHKRSAVAGKTPTIANLDLGEIGLNTHDGKAYMKKDDGTPSIVQIGDGANAGSLGGQQPSYYLDYNNLTNKPATFTANNGAITIQGSSGLTGSGSFTVDQAGNTTVTLSHADTSAQASVDNSGGTVIQDVSVDGFGHVTGLASVNLDTRYLQVGSKAADSDLLDGIDSTGFLRSNTDSTLTGTINLTQNPVGTTYGNSVSSSPPNKISQTVGDNDGWRLYGEAAATNSVRMVFEVVDDIEAVGYEWLFRNKKTYGDFAATEPFRISGAGAAFITGNTVWHAGNDGSGSGLDADLLDGYNVGTSGGAIPLLDGNNTWSGTNVFTSTAGFSVGKSALTSGYTDLGTNLRVGVYSKTGTYAQTGTSTITVTCANHGLTTGDSVYLDFTSGTAVDSYFNQVTVTSSSTFTVIGPVLTTSGNVTIFPESQIRFPGIIGDGASSYDHTVIAERLYGGSDDSELLIFKGNDGGTTVQDNIRLAATGDIYLHAGTSGASAFTYANYINSFGNSVSSSTVAILASGNTGLGIVNPGAKLDVYGTSRFGGTTSSGRRVDITTDGIATLAYGNNANQSNLVLQNTSNTAATTDHGNNILWQFGTNTTTTPISAGRVSILKEQQWTTTAASQDAYFAVDLAVDGALTQRLKLNSNGNLTISGTVTGSSIIRTGGTASQFLKADGSVDSNTYITSASVGNGTLTLNVSGTGLSGSQTFTANQSGNATFTVASNATASNTASTIVARDASGNFNAGTITAALTGNASTATIVNGTSGQNTAKDDRIIEPNSISSSRLQFGFTAWSNNNSAPFADYLHLRSYADNTGGNDNLVMFRKDAIGMRIWQQSWNSASAYATYVDVWHSGNDGSGSGLDADLLDGLNAASANTASTIVARDGSGNFSAGTITAALTGNASTATAAAGASFFTQATASEGTIGAQFTGQNSVYIYNNATNWGIYSASGGSAFQYTRTSGVFNFNGNANTATTLATARTIWGQSFNGSANVTGALSGATTITASSDITLGGELNFTTAGNKYIDFFTDNDAGVLTTAHLRLVNNAQNSFHSAIHMTRGGAVTLYHNNAAKLATSAGGADVTGTLSATTGLRAGNGTLGAPSISFTSDTDTGFWWDTANVLNLSCGGVLTTTFHDTFALHRENFIITNDGNSSVDSFSLNASSYNLALRGKYWTGSASANADWYINNSVSVPAGGAATPTSLLRFKYGTGLGSPEFTLTNGGGGTFTGTVQGTRFISTQATGTAPFTVSSTTLVTNLNADLLDGLNPSTSGTSNIVSRDASGNFSAGTITASLRAGNGTALAPSISFTSDTDTGFFWSSSESNSIQWSNNGATCGAFTTSAIYSYQSIFLFPDSNFNAISATPLRDSEALRFIGRYWTGTASADYRWDIYNDMIATTPTSRLTFAAQGVNKFYIEQNGNATFTGSVIVPQNNTAAGGGIDFNGAGSAYIRGRNQDGASATLSNLQLQSWYGIGFGPSISGQTIPQGENAFWINVRDGGWQSRGGGAITIPNNARGQLIQSSSTTQTSTLFEINSYATWSASPNNYAFMSCHSGNFGDLEWYVRGDGTTFGDGGYNTPADYAEYFEWEDGNPDNEDRRGYTVTLVGSKIRKSVEGDDVLGVVSGNPAIVCDAAWNHWTEKYIKDEFNCLVHEEHNIIEWEETVVNEDGTEKIETKSYEDWNIPSDVVVPENATIKSHDENGNKYIHPKLNPNYDPEQAYVPRNERKEWSAIGLVGKLRIRKGQPVSSRWIKMKEITENVDEWLIR